MSFLSAKVDRLGKSKCKCSAAIELRRSDNGDFGRRLDVRNHVVAAFFVANVNGAKGRGETAARPFQIAELWRDLEGFAADFQNFDSQNRAR